MNNSPNPSANLIESSYLTAKLVSSLASKVVDNSNSFFAACYVGGIDKSSLQASGPSGGIFRVPVGISDNDNVYTQEAFVFDFSHTRVERTFEMSGIIGLWIPDDKKYYVETFIKPSIVSMINEASAAQFNKFLNNGLIFADTASNVLESLAGSVLCGPTPDISLDLGVPSSLRLEAGIANIQAQILHNQAINSLGLLGTGQINAVGNIYSSKALSGVASWNQESLTSRVLSKFSIVNQITESHFDRGDNGFSASFMYADVNGAIEGPFSLLNIVEYVVENNYIVALKVALNPVAVSIIVKIVKGANEGVVYLKNKEAISTSGAGAAKYIQRSGKTNDSNPGEGGTFILTEDLQVNFSSTDEHTVNVKPVLLNKDINLLNRMSDYAPVMSLKNTKPTNARAFSFDAPVLQQNCKSGLISHWPWIVCDPFIIMSNNTPYEYVKPAELQAVDSDTEDGSLNKNFFQTNSIEMMLYSKGDVVNNKNVIKLEMFVDVGLNNKTYAIGMIPRIINYFDFSEQKQIRNKNVKKS